METTPTPFDAVIFNPRPLPPSEHSLRQDLLFKIDQQKESAFLPLDMLFGETALAHTPLQVRDILKNGIKKAVRNQRWSGNHGSEDNIGIGYYANASMYFTYILHEAAHFILHNLATDKSQRQHDSDWEEDFCWRFSQQACAVLELPYSNIDEQLNREFQQFISKNQSRMQERDVQEAFEALIKRDLEVNGYTSMSPFWRFRWTDDAIPVSEHNPEGFI